MDRRVNQVAQITVSPLSLYSIILSGFFAWVISIMHLISDDWPVAASVREIRLTPPLLGVIVIQLLRIKSNRDS